ncbi:RICIN domain-containing protein [Vibrio neonatus]|uniref:RICIN domain-containing protein n=1 Tax=Vibrio neonatus TaxID=278860 RepID=UPI0021C27998|nr:RICIN domain-containing protein [Vibrio neonatus]
MNRSFFKVSVLSIFTLFAAHVSAAAPKVPTLPPYIVLSDNLDEPNGYGFCIDTYGPGQSELMQTHSCKPKGPEGSPRNYSGHDVRFEYDAQTNRVQSYAYEGLCMQALLAKGKTEVALLECSEAKHQGFVYNKEDKTFRLQADTSYCLTVVSTTEEAGPWVKRALQLTQCDESEESVKQWTIVPEA